MAIQTSPALSLDELRRRERRTVAVGAGYTLGGTAITALLFVVLRNPIYGAAAVGGVIFVVALVVWLWDQPVRGAYVLFGAAVVLAAYVETGLTDYIGWYVPFFEDIKSWSHTPVIVSIGEVFITLTFVIWVLKGIANRNFRFDRGSLMLPLGLYMLMVLVAEMRGLMTGGSLHDSLWELRGQAYMFVAYLLVCNLVKNRSQMMKLIWILVIGAALRGIEGSFQYIFVLRAADISTHELYPHEQSYFFNAFLTLTIILCMFGGSTRMKKVALWLTPFVLLANLANNRRASIAALAIALIVLFLLTWLVQPRYRRAIGAALLVLAVVYPPYFFVYQNKTGLLALPARAIGSTFHPNAADASSNLYRVLEDLDIMTTVKSSPVLPYGFGKEMYKPYTLPKIGYVFQYLMPHNSVLWVWMRLGTMGYLIFWFLIGTAIVQATQLIRRLRDRSLQGLALFVVVMLIQQVTISYVDLQWSNYRTMIMTGVLFALISRLSMIGAAEARAAEANVQLRRSMAVRGIPVAPRKVQSVAAAARAAASTLSGQARAGRHIHVVTGEPDTVPRPPHSAADRTDAPRRRILRVITASPAGAGWRRTSGASPHSPLHIVEAEAVTPRGMADSLSSRLIEGQLIQEEPVPAEIVALRVVRKKRSRWLDRKRAPEQN